MFRNCCLLRRSKDAHFCEDIWRFRMSLQCDPGPHSVRRPKTTEREEGSGDFPTQLTLLPCPTTQEVVQCHIFLENQEQSFS